MKHLKRALESICWQKVSDQINSSGYALVKKLITPDHCHTFIDNYEKSELYRKTIIMERYRFGIGEYKYFTYPLPDIIQQIREHIYPKLVPIANKWMESVSLSQEFPHTFSELQQLCHTNKQVKPIILILKYGPGGYNIPIHQDLYGEIYFPMQLVLFLNEPEVDYTGGEFVLIQQNPRAQSKAVVLKPTKGDLLIFTTNFRAVKGVKGHHRVHRKHGVNEVYTGARHTLGIIFHDALT